MFSQLQKIIVGAALCLSSVSFPQPPGHSANPDPEPESHRVPDSLGVSPSLISFDSTLIKGSEYGSFADLFDLLPGGYQQDRGSVGQQSEGFLFGGTSASFVLDYDGLILNDPITGKADFNLIPVESIDRIDLPLQSGGSSSAFNPAGQTLRIEQLDLAGLPIRSRVAYRTGTGYDDNDVRLGIQATPELKINAGGILKNYGGTLQFSKYRAQKVNLKIERRLGAWQLNYLLLMNKADTDIPVVDIQYTGGEFRLPHQKDVRYDHGLFLSRGQFRTTLQYTDLKREYYGYRHTFIDLLNKTRRVRLESQYSLVSFLGNWVFAGRYDLLSLNSNEWGKHNQSTLGLMARLSANVRPDWGLNVQTAMHYNKDFDFFNETSASSHWRIAEGAELSGWLLRQTILPSMEARFAQDYLRNGDNTILPEQLLQAGLAWKLKRDRIEFFAANTLQQIRSQIISRLDESVEEWRFPNQYQNLDDFGRYSFDFNAVYQFVDWLSATGKLKYMYDFQEHNHINLPDFFWQGYFKFFNYLEKYDVDAQFRIGGEVTGPYAGANSLLSDVSDEYLQKGWQFYPYLHLIFEIGDVTLFGALLNPMNLDYIRVYDFPFPKAQLRWGFSWNFVD